MTATKRNNWTRNALVLAALLGLLTLGVVIGTRPASATGARDGGGGGGGKGGGGLPTIPNGTAHTASLSVNCSDLPTSSACGLDSSCTAQTATSCQTQSSCKVITDIPSSLNISQDQIHDVYLNGWSVDDVGEVGYYDATGLPHWPPVASSANCTCFCQSQSGSNCSGSKSGSGSVGIVYKLYAFSQNECTPNGFSIWGSVNSSWTVTYITCNAGYLPSGGSCVLALGTIIVNSLNSITSALVSSVWHFSAYPAGSNPCGTCSGTSQTYNNEQAAGASYTLQADSVSASNFALRNVGTHLAFQESNQFSLAFLENLLREVAKAVSISPTPTQPLSTNGTITFNILWDPVATMSVSPSVIDLTNTNPSRAVTVANGGASGSTLNWSASSSQSWLSASPTSGSLGSGSSQSVTLSASTGGLTSGNYSGTVTFSGTSSPGSRSLTSVSVAVNLSMLQDFTLSISPTSQSVYPSQSTTYQVSAQGVNGFSASTPITLSASGLPAGVTASFSPASITTGQTATLTASAALSTTPGTYTFTVTGTGGGITHNYTVTLVVNPVPVPSLSVTNTTNSSRNPNFWVGDSYQLTVTNALPNQPIQICFQNSGPTYPANGCYSPSAVFGGNPSNQTDSSGGWSFSGTFDSTAVGTWNVSAEVAGQTSNQISFQVLAPDFSLSVTPSSQSVTQGNSVTYQVSAQGVNGFNSSVALSASNLPSGATASFSFTSITPGQASTLTVTAGSGTPVGTYTLTVTGSSGSLSHSSSVTLTVNTAYSPTFVISSSSASIAIGQTYSFTAYYDPDGPSGPQPQQNQTANASWSSSNASIASQTSTPGQFQGNSAGAVTIQATYSGITAYATLNVISGFSLSISPSSQSATQGTSVTYTVTALGSNSSPISLSASSLPSGVTASFSSTSITPGQASTLTITVKTTTATGAYTFTVAGSNGSESHSYPVGLTVTSAPSPTLVISSSSASIAIGQTYSFTAYYDPDGPSGPQPQQNQTANASWSSSNASIASQTSTPGQFLGNRVGTVTITAVYSGITATASLSVTAAPDFSLSVTPTSQSVTQGNSVTYQVSAQGVNGFNSSVALSASGLPSGVTGSFAPTSIIPGQTAALILTTSPATAPGTYTFTVQGVSKNLTHTTSVGLTVNPSALPVSCASFTASPQKLLIPPPASTTLSWSCLNAVSCLITPVVTGSVNPSSGSAIVAPTSTTTYTLTCTNSRGPQSYQTTVTVYTPGLQEQ